MTEFTNVAICFAPETERQGLLPAGPIAHEMPRLVHQFRKLLLDAPTELTQEVLVSPQPADEAAVAGAQPSKPAPESTPAPAPEIAPILLRWSAAGQTAGYLILEKNSAAAAAALILSGLDQTEDHMAVAELAPQRLMLPPSLSDQLATLKKPAVVAIHFHTESFKDPAIATAIAAFAAAFFGMLGAGE